MWLEPELPLPWGRYEWPHCKQEVFLPLERLPLAPFTSSLVAVIILFLATPVACCVYWGQLHHRPPGQLLLYSHYTGSREQRRGFGCVCTGACVHVSVKLHMWLRLFLYLSVSNQHLCPSFSVFTDQNECEEFGSSVCGTWRCINTIGSYQCFMGCQPALEGEGNTDCGKWLNCI